MSGVAGHETLSEIAPGEPLDDAERVSIPQIMGVEWMLERMQIDADGVPGSYNDASFDPWQPYNARGGYNYADSVSFRVVGVAGNQLTLQTDGGTAAHVLLFTRRIPNPDYGAAEGLPRYLEEKFMGSVMPGWIGQFSGNSRLTHACWPIVTRIVSCSGTTLVVEMDKDCSGALVKYQHKDPETDQWVDDPGDVTIKLWHFSANPSAWKKIVRPDKFYAQQRTVTINTVPPDGLVKLSEKAVKDPVSVDPLHPTWTLEGRRIDTGAWENVAGAGRRLYVTSGSGPSWVALKTTKPPEGVEAPSGDLTAEYSAFRATFWEYVGPGAPSCAVVGDARCVFSVPVKDLGYTPPDGVKDGYVCLRRRYDINTPTKNGAGFISGMTHTLGTPSGLSRFEPLCMQHGCCDQYEAAETSGADSKPFSMQDMGRILRDMWSATNQRLYRLYPRVASFAAWQAQRVGHPSIMWHAGYIGLQTPNNIDGDYSQWRGGGMWGTNYYTYMDVHGNQWCDLITGGMDGVKIGDGTAQMLQDTDGHFAPAEKRDPVNPGAKITDRYLERIGAAVEKDTGAIQPHGLARSSVAVTAQNVVIPNISTTTGAHTQYLAGGSFERMPDGSGVVKLLPLRQSAKTEASLGTRVVTAVTDNGNGTRTIEFGNVQHTWSMINDGPEIGDSFDQLFTWEGGGGWPILPIESRRIDSWYESPKIAGSRAQGAWAGDALRGPDGRTHVIKSVDAHGGTAAATWGEDRYRKWSRLVPEIWMPNQANLAMGTPIETYGNWTITSVKRGSTVLALIESETRPAAIAAGQYWYDASGLYVGAAGALEIKYTVDGKTGDYTEYKTVPAALEIDTGIAKADWTGASQRAVTVDDRAPGAGYVVDTSGATVKMEFGLLDAYRSLSITLKYTGQAPVTPQDHWCVGGSYTTFGKRRDIAVVFDGAGIGVGDTVEFLKSAAVSMPGWTLQWTPHGTDTWAAVTGAVVRAGDGTAEIPSAWFDGKPPVVCFRAAGVSLMDHRGIVPAGLLNKTVGAVKNMQWVKAGMGGSRGTWSYNNSVVQQAWYTPEGVETAPVYESPISATKNGFSIGIGPSDFIPPGPPSEFMTWVTLVTSASMMGWPITLRSVPDGTQIIKAVATINAAGLTRQYNKNILYDTPCGQPYNPYSETTTDLVDISFGLIGVQNDSFSLIGQTVKSNVEGSVVTDVTGIMQTLFGVRSQGVYDGFGLIAMPPDVTATGDGLIGMLQPIPGIGQLTICEGGSNRVVPGWTTWESTALEWDSITLWNIIMQVKYPDEEFTRELIVPRWPAMV